MLARPLSWFHQSSVEVGYRVAPLRALVHAHGDRAYCSRPRPRGARTDSHTAPVSDPPRQGGPSGRLTEPADTPPDPPASDTRQPSGTLRFTASTASHTRRPGRKLWAKFGKRGFDTGPQGLQRGPPDPPACHHRHPAITHSRRALDYERSPPALASSHGHQNLPTLHSRPIYPSVTRAS
jgi:hypothetical protein